MIKLSLEDKFEKSLLPVSGSRRKKKKLRLCVISFVISKRRNSLYGGKGCVCVCLYVYMCAGC